MTSSSTHLILIPSYNPGARLLDTVRAARECWAPVWVVDDGSSDDSAAALEAATAGDPQVRIWRRAHNGGKGAAIFDGLQHAAQAGFSHVLTLDADGQHPAQSIVAFMAASAAAPGAMILGVPRFDTSAPRARVYGRRISNWATGVETLGAGIGDSLFGFRVYPVAPLLEVMRSTRWMRRFDFDAEAVVRLFWRGVPFINVPAPVRYFPPREGGVSHFHYVRDNVLLTGMYFRLFGSFLLYLPGLLRRRLV